jgi:protein TonB
MSPVAVALAVLLHAMVALVLWWVAQHRPLKSLEDVLEVTIEQVKPPEPPPPPPPEPPKAEAPPEVMPPIEGLRPPADIVSDKPTQAPPKGDQPKDALLAPPPPPLQDTLPAPDPQPPAPTAADFAKPEPEPAPEPPKQAAAPEPAPEPPKPPAAAQAPAGELPKPPPPAPKPPEPKPPQQQALAAPPPPKPHPPAPPPPQLQRPELRPSPLTTAPPKRPPAGTKSENPSPSPFVNPADTYNRARVADNYLWQIVQKLQGYRYTANVQARQGITVVRVVIARDGRLLSVSVARSSGYPEFDNGVLAGVRSGSPYAPLPPDIKGASATFDLPLISVQRN